MNDAMNPYLWDKSGTPDPEIERLEGLLAEFRQEPQPLRAEAAAAAGQTRAWKMLRPLLRWRFAGAAAFATAAVVVGFLLLRARFEWQANRPWKVESVAGQPQVADPSGKMVRSTAELAVGEVLETNATSKAQLNIGRIGVLDLEPNTRVRLLATRSEHHRIALDYGTITAHTWAPPFSFAVETPSSSLFDLGCSFTLHMDRSGYGLVHVDSGWVQFEYGGNESLVPADAEAITRPNLGPGTAYFADAAPAFKSALATFDTSEPGSEVRRRALETVLANARPRDAITLLNLMGKTEGADRERTLDVLSRFVPLPKGVTRAQALALELEPMNRYWEALGLGNPKSWVMHWKDVITR